MTPSMHTRQEIWRRGKAYEAGLNRGLWLGWFSGLAGGVAMVLIDLIVTGRL